MRKLIIFDECKRNAREAAILPQGAHRDPCNNVFPQNICPLDVRYVSSNALVMS